MSATMSTLNRIWEKRSKAILRLNNMIVEGKEFGIDQARNWIDIWSTAYQNKYYERYGNIIV